MLSGGFELLRSLQVTWDHAVLTVANTGPPVPPDKAGQLLEPFQRLIDDRVSHPDGHGLGLSIVRAIADAHGAHLEVSPRPHGGLTIITRFPPLSGPRSDGQATWAPRSATG